MGVCTDPPHPPANMLQDRKHFLIVEKDREVNLNFLLIDGKHDGIMSRGD